MQYVAIIRGFDSGLNEVLRGHIYDYRTRRVVNPIKAKNDRICMDCVRFDAPELRGVKLKTPVIIHYKFYCKNKRRDRSNIQSGFIKSFEDALQKVGILSNDSWDCVVGMTTDFAIDKDDPRVLVVIEEVDKEKTFWDRWSVIESLDLPKAKRRPF